MNEGFTSIVSSGMAASNACLHVSILLGCPSIVTIIITNFEYACMNDIIFILQHFQMQRRV